jgi:hypothetical protein
MTFEVYNRNEPRSPWPVEAATIDEATKVAAHVIGSYEPPIVTPLSPEVVLIAYPSDAFAVCAKGAMHPFAE